MLCFTYSTSIVPSLSLSLYLLYISEMVGWPSTYLWQASSNFSNINFQGALHTAHHPDPDPCNSDPLLKNCTYDARKASASSAWPPVNAKCCASLTRVSCTLQGIWQIWILGIRIQSGFSAHVELLMVTYAFGCWRSLSMYVMLITLLILYAAIINWYKCIEKSVFEVSGNSICQSCKTCIPSVAYQRQCSLLTTAGSTMTCNIVAVLQAACNRDFTDQLLCSHCVQ